MKNSDRHPNEVNSPKTPGGISKSLLTPIRRLGLSRKWKKSGSSPFVSPLASNTVKPADSETEEKRSRKRKLCVDDDAEHLQLSPATESTVENAIISTPPTTADSTPIRRISITRKKSKTLISSSFVSKSEESAESQVNLVQKQIPRSIIDSLNDRQVEETGLERVQTNISCEVNIKSPRKAILKNENIKDLIINNEMGSDIKQIANVVKLEPKIPNNLTKECIVVIQNKILKPVKNAETKTNDLCDKRHGEVISQVIFDADSDDVPLSHINKKENLHKSESVNLDDDFADSKIKRKLKVHKLKTKTSSTSSRKTINKSDETIKRNKEENLKEKIKQVVTLKPSSQSSNSFDNDDDDFEPNKRTILVRKSYDKVVKPSKAKSTGSITQKDIDELKARIEMKKKLLLAKSMTNDTEELRGLIKKWQKGCQDALMELLELMKNKLPDQTNMDHSYILQMLKIPPALVGYDSENDCFNTPDDNSILAVTFNDL